MFPAPQYPKAAKIAGPAHKVSKITWIGLLTSAAAASMLIGCAAETAADQDSSVAARVTTGTSSPTIFGGSMDNDTQAIPGVVALRVGKGGTFELCSGALVAPNVVLTARHCITRNLTTSVSCDENGHSANGPHVEGNQDPATVGIYTGANPSFGAAPVTTARAVVAPTGSYLCDSDIALVILEDAITDIAPLAIRMDSTATAGEMVRTVGYGQNDDAAPIGTRFRKSVSVLAQGQAITASKTPLGPHEFEVGKSICQGDSGGPAISEETGAVIGVVSRGGNCDEDFGHIYTTTAGFSNLFAQAFTLANATPTPEGGSVGVTTAAASTKTDEAKDDSGKSAGCTIGGAVDRGSAGGSSVLVLVTIAVALGLRRRRG